MSYKKFLLFHSSLFMFYTYYIVYQYASLDYQFQQCPVYNLQNQQLPISIFEKCYIKTADVVLELVNNYFYTFRFCWRETLIYMTKMILGYIGLLRFLIEKFLVYPTDIVCCIASVFLLFIVRIIIKDLFSIKNKFNKN